MAISRRQLMAGGAAAALGPYLLPGPAHAASAMAVSFGKRDITPDVGEFMAGYAVDTPRAATAIERDLFARCIVLWDNGVPNVIVSADTLAFPRSMNLEIRQRVADLGVANSDFILTATHTHNGGAVVEKLDPYMAYNMTAADIASVQAYSDYVMNQIAALVAETLAQTPVPCTLDYQVLYENFSINRENLGYVEQDVPTLTARGLDGRPLAVLFGYGCHPVTRPVTDRVITPDYPGVAADLIQERTGAFAQFVLGPAGDQNPQGAQGAALTQELGTRLGLVVVHGLGTPGRPVTGPIATAYENVDLPLDITLDPANLAEVRRLYGTRIDPGPRNHIERHAERMIAQIDSGTFETSVPLPIQRWQFQGTPALRLAFTGGELVSGYAVYFRQRHGGSDSIWITGYANEIPAYIPSDELLYISPGIYYACGWSPPDRGIAGGSMWVYGYLGHFRGRPPGSTVDGVEQILINRLTALL